MSSFDFEKGHSENGLSSRPMLTRNGGIQSLSGNNGLRQEALHTPSVTVNRLLKQLPVPLLKKLQPQTRKASFAGGEYIGSIFPRRRRSLSFRSLKTAAPSRYRLRAGKARWGCRHCTGQAIPQIGSRSARLEPSSRSSATHSEKNRADWTGSTRFSTAR